jgi:xanthine dehydrogenase molybdopterin-binding subunit B
MKEPTGKIVRIKEQTSSYMTVELDNGVSVHISFNNGDIYMNFGGIAYKQGLEIREAELLGQKLPLANFVTVQYRPRQDS